MMLFSFLLLLAVYVSSIVSAFPFMANTGPDSDLVRSTARLRSLDENSLGEGSDFGENLSGRQLGPILTNIFSIGGGLFNGILQPFTGILAALEVPVRQQESLMAIPGDDLNHQYQAPGPTDVRGPCPGLNTMANHGYVSRTGITTFAEAANACQIAFGLGYDFSILVSLLGLLSGGDLVSGKYSIGGPDARVPNTSGQSLGAGKHGFFESDNSFTRVDAYFGNAANFSLDRWNNDILPIVAKHGGLFSNEMMAEERVNTYNYARANNPMFTAEIIWFVVTIGTRMLVAHVFPNGTNPTVPDMANIAPFYLNETFPPKWYRQFPTYNIVDLVNDIVDILQVSGAQTPLGQNEGVNDFIVSGIDPSTFSPEQVACMLLEAVMDLSPGFVSPMVAQNFELVMSFLGATLVPLFADWNCPLQYWSAPGSSAGDSTPGVSTSKNILINGVYY